jgi:hypothetical protein
MPEKKHKRCLNNERDLIDMNLRQPQSMVVSNYPIMTWMIFLHLVIFRDTNRGKAKPENWPAGNTYTNHWEAPSTMVNLEDKTMKDGGFVLKQTIWNAARDTISEWTGQQLAFSHFHVRFRVSVIKPFSFNPFLINPKEVFQTEHKISSGIDIFTRYIRWHIFASGAW